MAAPNPPLTWWSTPHVQGTDAYTEKKMRKENVTEKEHFLRHPILPPFHPIELLG